MGTTRRWRAWVLAFARMTAAGAGRPLIADGVLASGLLGQMAQVPVEQDAADVEDYAAIDHPTSRHAKAPPEASDGVTLARR